MINYTPVTVIVRDENGIDHVFPPSGIVARVEMKTVPCPPLPDGTPTISVEYGDGILPKDHPGECIVSTMFADSYVEKYNDPVLLFVPDNGPTAIRENGQIIAVRALIRR